MNSMFNCLCQPRNTPKLQSIIMLNLQVAPITVYKQAVAIFLYRLLALPYLPNQCYSNGVSNKGSSGTQYIQIAPYQKFFFQMFHTGPCDLMSTSNLHSRLSKPLLSYHPSKQSRSADVSPMSVQRQFNVELTLD